MDKDNKKRNEEQQPFNVQPVKQDEKNPRSSAFNEPVPGNEKSTSNSEEADLEQQRKDAMTERD
jgi:hypothetical protein